MKKGTTIGLFIFVILSGSIFMLLANAHIDIFPGKEHSFDFFTKQEKWEDKSVALLTVLNPDLGPDNMRSSEDDYSELTINGYAILLLVVVGIPLLLTWPFARRFNRRAARKAQEAATRT
ncbi:MAG: hypothetical protein ACHQF2_05940 [Flavobacteriales bacterium]